VTHVAAAALELGFEFHFELGKIDQVPARKSPHSVPFPWLACQAGAWRRLVLEPDNEMDRVIADFVGRPLWLEVKCAKRAVAASNRVKLRIETEDRALVFVAIVGQAHRLPELQWQPERLPYNLEARQKREA